MREQILKNIKESIEEVKNESLLATIKEAMEDQTPLVYNGGM